MRLFRRHAQKCKFFGTEDSFSKTNCRCPIYVDTGLRGRDGRKSLGIRDWSRAENRIRRMEEAAEGGRPVVKVQQALQAFLSDCKRRNLKQSTLRGYEKTLEHLAHFCESQAVDLISELSQTILLQFQNGREAPPRLEGGKSKALEASTTRKELQTLRVLFGFLVDQGHVGLNCAKKLKPPKEHRRQTLPFSQSDVDRLIEAANTLEDDNSSTRERNQARARAAVLTMLYSGLRISDTATLERPRVDLKDGRLLLRMEKTGEPVYVKLGVPALSALRALPVEGRYFFWTGHSSAATAIGNIRRTIYRLCDKAGISGHPHRFRDTFAVRLLENGVAIDQVSLLLGHASVKTTEKYYAPWVRSRQRLLDEAVGVLDFVEPAQPESRRLTRMK